MESSTLPLSVPAPENRTIDTNLHDFICQLQPRRWGDPTHWHVREWLNWPPDIFALTSLLLKYTGAYRRAIVPSKEVWPPHEWGQDDWAKTAKRVANKWRRSIASGFAVSGGTLEVPEEIAKYVWTMINGRMLLVDQFYNSLSDDSDPDRDPWEVCKALLALHAIADEAMHGVGNIFSPRSNLIWALPGQKIGEQTAWYYLQANYLLALRGSLSRIPKFRGIVLPKSRTPQVGLSLRNLSNHLSFHESEVDVAWRAFPWFNFDENTLNVMIVPWPYDLDAQYFSTVAHPNTRPQLGSDRYFHYAPRGKNFDVEHLLGLIQDAKREMRRIHLLVFPEMSLRREELEHIKRRLKRMLPTHEMPMIIAGVSVDLEEDPPDAAEQQSPRSERKWSTDPNFRPTAAGAGANRVVLSVYYSHKWHDVIQDKHHRWRIDERQIEQYNLGGMLSGARSWWEAIEIPRRRLSVLAANSWLTVAPLICEDLARLEPVSDMIRGIGPTLLVALLLDGPQLVSRWSARYASVMADDPGSSVLTLTALGMSRRSRITGDVGQDSREQDKAREKSRTVALWKDQIKGWREIRVGEDGQSPPKILIVSAKWTDECSVDGRSETENSAVFTYQGSYQPVASEELDRVREPSNDLVRRWLEKDLERESWSGSKGKKPRDLLTEKTSESVLDMCELTLYTFYVDALVDSRSDPDALLSWFKSAMRPGTDPADGPRDLKDDLLMLIRYSMATRESVPSELPSPHLLYCVDRITRLVKRTPMPRDAGSDLLRYWTGLVDEAEKDIKSVLDDMIGSIENRSATYWITVRRLVSEYEKKSLASRSNGGGVEDTQPVAILGSEIGRIDVGVPLSILWAVYSRLTTRRRYGTLRPEDAALLSRAELLLQGERIAAMRSIGAPYDLVYFAWKNYYWAEIATSGGGKRRRRAATASS